MPYFKTEKYELVRMNYGNGAYAMTLLLPSKDSSLGEVLQTLDAEAWAAWKSNRVVKRLYA